MAVVQTGSLLSFSRTSLVQLTTMGSLARFLNNSKSLLSIVAGLGLASPCSDKKLISVVGSSVGYLLEYFCNMMVSNGVIGAICS